MTQCCPCIVVIGVAAIFQLPEEKCRVERIFRHVYRNNIWGDPETVSGPGSGVARTAAFRDQFANLLIQLGTRSLLDAGCGDFNWMKEVQLPVGQYFGIDIVPELIAKNQ